jgi:hypothetical protein
VYVGEKFDLVSDQVSNSFEGHSMSSIFSYHPCIFHSKDNSIPFQDISNRTKKKNNLSVSQSVFFGIQTGTIQDSLSHCLFILDGGDGFRV